MLQGGVTAFPGRFFPNVFLENKDDFI
jgi:hypothetical protein